MKTKTFFTVLGLFVKSWFMCLHLPGDCTVIRLNHKVKDLPNDIFPCEVWNTRALCECGETVDQEFVFSDAYRKETFNDDGTRIEDVK